MIRIIVKARLVLVWAVAIVSGPLMDGARAATDPFADEPKAANPSAAISTRSGHIEVALRSGRTFGGEIDAQTDADVLWLRSSHGSIVLVRPIEWGRVVRASVGGKEFSGDELRALAERAKTARPEPAFGPAAPAPPPPLPASDAGALPWPAPPTEAPRPRVASINVDAQLAHWTPTVESSGLSVRVTPLDSDGRAVAIDGTLEVELLGREPAVNYMAGDFPLVGRWTFAVRADDVGPSGAVYQCPFQALHPDFDTQLYAHGLVHARLTVPEQGVFEVSQPVVRIRQYSPMRDRLQETTNERFFSVEQTERGN
jgi:hypothetical protein